MSLTRRALRHALPKIRAAFLSPAVFLIGYLCGSCLRYGWLWGQEQVEILPGVVAITCGLALLGVALLLAAEIDDLYQGWMRKQWVEDRYRCPVCDDPVKKPATRVGGEIVCLECAPKELPRLAGDPV